MSLGTVRRPIRIAALVLMGGGAVGALGVPGARAAQAAKPGDEPPSPAPISSAGPAASSRARRLSLAEAERIALEHQPSLAQARGQSEAAEGRVEQARSGYLPQVNLTATYQRTTGNYAPRPGALPSVNGVVTSTSWSSTTY